MLASVVTKSSDLMGDVDTPNEDEERKVAEGANAADGEAQYNAVATASEWNIMVVDGLGCLALQSDRCTRIVSRLCEL